MDLNDDEDLKEMIRTNEYIYDYIDRRQWMVGFVPSIQNDGRIFKEYIRWKIRLEM